MSLYLSKNDDKHLDSKSSYPIFFFEIITTEKVWISHHSWFRITKSPYFTSDYSNNMSHPHIKSCWGNFESKIFYLGSISPLCGRHSHPIIVNLYCNIFNKIQPSSSPSWIYSFERRFLSHGRSLIVIEKILFWKIHLWGKKLLGEKHSKYISSNR